MHRSIGPQRRHAGFTLLELLMAMGILAVLTAMAAPPFRDLLASRQAQAGMNLLLTDMRYARSEAIRRNHSVTVCRSDDGKSCSGSANRWETGWIVFADRDAHGIVDPGEQILRVQRALPGITQANYSGNYVTYRPTGMAPGHNGTLEMIAKMDSDAGKRRVCVSNGRVRNLNDGGCASST